MTPGFDSGKIKHKFILPETRRGGKNIVYSVTFGKSGQGSIKIISGSHGVRTAAGREVNHVKSYKRKRAPICDAG